MNVVLNGVNPDRLKKAQQILKAIPGDGKVFTCSGDVCIEPLDSLSYKKISPFFVVQNAWSTLLIALTTASSATASATNTQDTNNKLGIDKRHVEFGIPVGQVLFKPGFFVLLFGVGIPKKN